MKKNIILLGTLLISSIAFSQVGVNTDAPKTTMDVSAKRDTSGVITDNAQLIGLQAPRLTRAELTANTATYGADQKGALVYITDVSGGDASGQRVNITAIGYYHFDGSFWVTMGGSPTAPVNIYNANGSLTGERYVDLNGHALNFTGSEGSTKIDTGGASVVIESESATRAQLRFSTQDVDADGVTSGFDIDLFADNYLQMFAGGEMNGISFGTHVTQNPSPIEFVTSPGGMASGVARMKIMGTGNVGINTTTPTERLDNGGITRLRTLPLNGATNAIYTTSGGSASATQNQTFTATKTVVADANGVLGSVNWVASPPLVLAGADGADAVATTQTIRSRNNSSASTTALKTVTFNLAKKSLVTISCQLTVGSITAWDNTNLVDGLSKKLDSYVVLDGVTTMSSAIPYTNAGAGSATFGNFILNYSRSYVLNAGSHTASLYGEVFAVDSTGVQATFGSWNDQFDIIAVPIP